VANGGVEIKSFRYQEDRMKHLLVAALVVSCAIALGLGAWAQDAAPKEHSMTGCLAKGTEAGTYQLTDLEKGPKSVGIVSSTANLAPHVGHKVELTGTAVAAKDAEADSKVPKAPHYMKITAVKMISATCP
jgi:hypothetical protein